MNNKNAENNTGTGNDSRLIVPPPIERWNGKSGYGGDEMGPIDAPRKQGSLPQAVRGYDFLELGGRF